MFTFRGAFLRAYQQRKEKKKKCRQAAEINKGKFRLIENAINPSLEALSCPSKITCVVYFFVPAIIWNPYLLDSSYLRFFKALSDFEHFNPNSRRQRHSVESLNFMDKFDEYIILIVQEISLCTFLFKNCFSFGFLC